MSNMSQLTEPYDQKCLIEYYTNKSSPWKPIKSLNKSIMDIILHIDETLLTGFAHKCAHVLHDEDQHAKLSIN